MVTHEDLVRLMEREEGRAPVLSLYLDLTPEPGRGRAHDVFLARQKQHLGTLAAVFPGLRRAELDAVMERAARWADDEAGPATRGAALFAEVGGAWFQAMELPVPLPNLLTLGRLPAVAPLARVLQGQRRHAVVLADRVHLRMLAVWLGRVTAEEEVRKEPAHEAGGHGDPFAEQHQQRRRLEEERHVFAEFAGRAAAFAARHRAEEVVLAGTEETVAKLRRCLAPELAAQVARTAALPVDAPAAEVVERLWPAPEGERDPELRDLLVRLRERAGVGYRAATGLESTLAALQAGNAEAVVLPEGAAARGSRCTRCGFLFAEERAACPYDGAPAETGVAVVEEALRLAAAQGARARLLPPEAAREFAGAGVLMRF
jgi:Bacterial archaeo-eukaryotic release factor family 10